MYINTKIKISEIKSAEKEILGFLLILFNGYLKELKLKYSVKNKKVPVNIDTIIGQDLIYQYIPPITIRSEIINKILKPKIKKGFRNCIVVKIKFFIIKLYHNQPSSSARTSSLFGEPSRDRTKQFVVP
jgi:hypothetical protein